MWSINDRDRVVGFAMISDGIPVERLASDPDLIGPYYLWRLLIDRRVQRRGYGSATLDAIVAYVRTRPGADVLLGELPARAMGAPAVLRALRVRAHGRSDGDEVVLRLDLTDRPKEDG